MVRDELLAEVEFVHGTTAVVSSAVFYSATSTNKYKRETNPLFAESHPSILPAKMCFFKNVLGLRCCLTFVLFVFCPSLFFPPPSAEMTTPDYLLSR